MLSQAKKETETNVSAATRGPIKAKGESAENKGEKAVGGAPAPQAAAASLAPQSPAVPVPRPRAPRRSKADAAGMDISELTLFGG